MNYANPLEVVLRHPDAKVPARGTSGAAAFDLYSVESVDIPPGKRAKVNTGVSIALPPGIGGFVWPRSGLAWREGAMVMAGLIDPDYQGEIQVVLYNSNDSVLEIRSGDRVGQIVLQPFVVPDLMVVSSFSETTERGSDGFGSTGKK